MMSQTSSGNIVQTEWQSTAEGETVLQHFYDPHTAGRKLFGILERPQILPNIEEVSYKLCFVGKAGVGKTTTVARLAGTNVRTSYVETLGIRKTNIFWPVKIWDKIILFKLHCWEAGDNSVKKYSHILPSCKEKADGIVFLFSFTDKNSWSDLPQLITKMGVEEANKPAVIAIGTRFSTTGKLDVTPSEVAEFELKWHIGVHRLGKSSSSDRNEVHKMAPLLNTICEKLWVRDQEYLLKQGLVVL